jgi:hypothetical protein
MSGPRWRRRAGRRPQHRDPAACTRPHSEVGRRKRLADRADKRAKGPGVTPERTMKRLERADERASSGLPLVLSLRRSTESAPFSRTFPDGETRTRTGGTTIFRRAGERGLSRNLPANRRILVAVGPAAKVAVCGCFVAIGPRRRRRGPMAGVVAAGFAARHAAASRRRLDCGVRRDPQGPVRSAPATPSRRGPSRRAVPSDRRSRRQDVRTARSRKRRVTAPAWLRLLRSRPPPTSAAATACATSSRPDATTSLR